jgi:hypothetical protein
MGTPAAADGMKPLISPTGDSIEGGGPLSDFAGMRMALERAAEATKRGKSTLDHRGLPDLLSNS